MAQEGKRISNDDLKFFDNLEEAKADLGRVDLVLTSGALQYCPDPLQFLELLADVGAKHLFITRTSFNTDDETLISTQVSSLSAHGIGPLPEGFTDRRVVFPVTFVSKTQVENILKRKYTIRFSITEDKDAYRVKGKKLDMYGYFCDLSVIDMKREAS